MECKRTVMFEIKSLANLVHRYVLKSIEDFAEDGLTGMRAAVVGYIVERSRTCEVRQKDIERRFIIRRSTATCMLQQLEKLGYITREGVRGDARVKNIVPTKKAEDIFDILERELERVNGLMLEGIPEKDIQEFFSVIGAIKKNLEKGGEKSAFQARLE
jgi:DNA-binding MarR family transcriptional regulator